MALIIYNPNELISWFHQNNLTDNKNLISKPQIKNSIEFVEPHIIKIKRFPVTIGRKDDNNIVISNMAISKKHAEIIKRGLIFKDYFIRDLGSTDGTTITKNGGKTIIRVTRDYVKLDSGDKIHLSRIILDIL
jgi:pSer/pThr/pTyr-binding forkhead associated (FHA) protein